VKTNVARAVVPRAAGLGRGGTVKVEGAGLTRTSCSTLIVSPLMSVIVNVTYFVPGSWKVKLAC
jgi:hypothetical protein